MLTQIARFEFRYLLRNPLLWLTALATFAMIFAGMSVEGFELGSEGGLNHNSAYATVRNAMMISVFYMFVTTSFLANVVLRDEETGFGPIVRSTPITKVEYLSGRFFGAFLVAAICLLLVPLATVIGTAMPWAETARIGPTRLGDHLYAYFVIALPNLFIHSAIFFALATITRSMMATYFGVLAFISAFMTLQGSFIDQPGLRRLAAILDPFASRALADANRYWTIAERNVTLPDVAGPLLANRLLWIGVAVLCLALAHKVFRFADGAVSKRALRRQKLVEQAEARPVATSDALTLPSARHGGAAARAVLWLRTKFEVRQVVLSPAFFLLLAWGMFTTFFVLFTQRDPDGRPTYPTTLSLIPEIADAFSMIPLVIAIYYAGELVWRERDRRMHELLDSSAIPNWAYVVPKTLAMATVLVAVLLINVAASVGLQLSLGFTAIEPGKYLLWYVIPTAWDMLLIAALAVFVQALSPHKVVGWGIMVLFIVWQYMGPVEHNLLNFGGKPEMPLSDMNAGGFWQGPWMFRLYWGAAAGVLLLVGHLLWRRGTDVRLRPRLALARRRLRGPAGLTAAATLAVFAGTGACAYYNTNVLNEYQSEEDAEAWAADLEKKYWKYHDLPQPTITHLTFDVALEPEARRAITRGSYRLLNDTPEPIGDVHVRLQGRGFELTRAELTGARLVENDERFNYRIYRLDQPMQPGEERVLSFETRRWHRGFPNGKPHTRLIGNGTFLTTPELAPIIGINDVGFLGDRETRRKHGLPEEPPTQRLEDAESSKGSSARGSWVTADITVSTTATQTPVAPGRKVSDVTKDGRRTARFVSDRSPIHPYFSVQSARYAERHRRHAGVDLAVYYHPAHAWNVDRMLDAMAASLDYYQKHFGPYQFDYARIVEFPGYAYYAQAFAGTIPYSEMLGFISDFDAPETPDHVTGVTAHELAHQYWGHQIAGGGTQGDAILTETLAQYSALVVVKKLRGEDQIRRHLQLELNTYLNGRAGLTEPEPPLVRVENERFVTYQKGAMAVVLLEKRMGEEAINRALRNFLDRYKFKGPPHPRSIDLVEFIRAEARTEEEQALITDLFERVTLYDLEVGSPTAVRRADGKWDVTVPIAAKKVYVEGRDSLREAPLAERIEVGLFTEEPGRDAFDASNVILMERRPIRSGKQVLHFVTAQRPSFAGVDPYNYYIDRDSEDNVAAVGR